MSLRLKLISLGLRLIEKPRLTRARRVEALRGALKRSARRLFIDPPDLRTQPARAPSADGWVPVAWASAGPVRRDRILLYLHGGAFALGAPETHRHLAADIAGRAGARAVLPDYRLAPEHPFPAALNDVYSVYRWLLDTGYAPDRIALAGDSAGGNLVAGVVQMAARDGAPPPACMAFLSPFADMRLTAHSLKRNARRDPFLPASRLPDVVGGYLDGASPEDPLASVVLGAYRDPPPALIQVGAGEILKDDAEALAARLRDCGGDVRLEVWRGAPHVWQIWRGRAVEADQAIARIGAFIAEHLDRADRR